MLEVRCCYKYDANKLVTGIRVTPQLSKNVACSCAMVIMTQSGSSAAACDHFQHFTRVPHPTNGPLLHKRR
jgi:hypothetical protein